MNLEALLSERLVERLGWTLVQFVWQGALVAVVLVMALVVLRRHSAAMRYVAACMGLLLMAILPVATFYVGTPPTPTPSPHARPEATAAPVPTGTAGRSGQDHAPGLTALEATTEPHLVAPATPISLVLPRLLEWRTSKSLEPILPWAVFAWFVGAFALSVRLSGGWALAECLRRMGVRSAEVRLQGTLLRLCTRLQVSRPVQVLESGLARVPMVVGWLRPVILLPASAVSGLSPAQIEAILAHELAHVTRHDYLVNLLQSVAEVLLFYHPAVWWVSGRIRVEREHCCDDVAVGLCGDAVLYARALAELELLRAPSPEPAVAAASGRLLTRIRRIAEPPQSDERPGGWLAGVAALAIGVLLLTTLLFPPRQATGQAARAAQVTVVCAEDVPETCREPVAEVVRVAKQAFDARFPELAKEEIALRVLSAADGYWEGALTDRRNTIYVRVGRHGLGEYFRPDADPVTILCQAVAELHNPNRLPGFDRFIAHRYLVPEVVEELGAEPLPGARLNPDAEDPTGRLVLMADPVYASVHPDFAAASAMADIEQALGFEALTELLAEGLSSATDPFSAFRAAALAKAPTLADAFTLRDEAVRLQVRPDGTSVVASFEPDEGVRVLTTFGPLSSLGDTPIVATDVYQPSFSDEWATDGEYSLRLDAGQTRSAFGLMLSDPDWKYADWTRFARCQMDLRYEGVGPATVYAYAFDSPSRAHANLQLSTGRMEPGAVRHVSTELTARLLSQASPTTDEHYDGAFRAREVAGLQITVHKPAGPFTLYVDNICLTPRAGAGPSTRPGPAADRERGEGRKAETLTPDEALRLQERQMQLDAVVEMAQALKRAGKLREAEAKLRRVLELDPANLRAHRVLGWTLVDLGLRTEAAKEFRGVLELNPSDAVREEAEKALERLR
jgi:beta-lactamase regulating signal transducer with metallopeptidase domain